MTLKAKIKGNIAVVRWNNMQEQKYFEYIMIHARDTPGNHPKVSIKAGGRELKIPKPKPLPVKKIEGEQKQ